MSTQARRLIPPVTAVVVCTQDRFFPDDFMRRVVTERLGILSDEIHAGHCVALRRPADLADRLATCVIS